MERKDLGKRGWGRGERKEGKGREIWGRRMTREISC
jgi:hypothetical protein